MFTSWTVALRPAAYVLYAAIALVARDVTDGLLQNVLSSVVVGGVWSILSLLIDCFLHRENVDIWLGINDTHETLNIVDQRTTQRTQHQNNAIVMLIGHCTNRWSRSFLRKFENVIRAHNLQRWRCLSLEPLHLCVAVDSRYYCVTVYLGMG